MSATAANAVRLAASQDGVQESPPGSNICKFSTWFGVRGPWCAMFLSWVWYSIGLRFPNAQTAKGWASAQMMHDYFKRRGWIVTTPRPGDAVFWHMTGGHAGINHVSLYVSGSSSVASWDGNTSTASDQDGGHVEKRTRPRRGDRGYVVAYGRPPYVPGTTTTKPPTWWHRNILLTSPYMKGDDVAAAARRLKAHGFDPGLPIDIAGPKFDQAVHDFQVKKGLKPDRIVGPTTATALGG